VPADHPVQPDLGGTMSRDDIEARGDEYPVPGESMPIESGGWWTPYTETTWGYFRFAIRPVEQPDGLLMFWHDAEGAHTAAIILDPPASALSGLGGTMSSTEAGRALLERLWPDYQSGAATYDTVPEYAKDADAIRDIEAEAAEKAVSLYREALRGRIEGLPDTHCPMCPDQRHIITNLPQPSGLVNRDFLEGALAAEYAILDAKAER
jgi:hypothetical protein